jgi:hypothetical protein
MLKDAAKNLFSIMTRTSGEGDVRTEICRVDDCDPRRTGVDGQNRSRVAHFGPRCGPTTPSSIISMDVHTSPSTPSSSSRLALAIVNVARFEKKLMTMLGASSVSALAFVVRLTLTKGGEERLLEPDQRYLRRHRLDRQRDQTRKQGYHRGHRREDGDGQNQRSNHVLDHEGA